MIDTKTGNLILQPSTSQLWTKTYTPNVNENQTSGIFHISSKTKQYKEVSLILNGQHLYKSKEKVNVENQQTKWKILNISNALLETIKHPVFCEGVKITLNSYNLEIYGRTTNFFDKMKKWCTQCNFTQKYSILKLIGQGSYGKVYKAKNKQNHVEYAIKTFEKALLQKKSDKQSLFKELEICRLMEHENTLRIFETYESEQFIFVVYDYLRGGNLKEQIKIHQKFSEKKSFTIIRQILHGLDYIHNIGIIHRDIKPENIMLKNRDCLDDLVIADFGLADHFKKDGKYLFSNCGTPGYCAPELLSDRFYDYKADIYSLGIVLYQLLVGEIPFQADDYQQRIKQNTQGLIDWSQVQLRGEALDLLQGMLARNPLQRLSASQCLNHKYYNHFVPDKQMRPVVSSTLLSTGSQLSTPSPNDYFKQMQKSPQQSPMLSPRINSLSKIDFDELDNLILEQQTKKRLSIFCTLGDKRKQNDSFNSPQIQQKHYQNRSIQSEALMFFQE